MSKLLTTYFSPRVYPLFALGIASGLPLALTASTLQAWATVSGVSLASIGFLSLVGTAYTWKFLWAPFLDRYVPPFLGRRRGWMIISQLALAAVLIAMGFLEPSKDLVWLAMLATLTAFLSATQDIAFDAYSTDILKSDERAAGAAIRTFGYRIGMILSGGLALVLAKTWLGWGGVYQVMGGLMILAAIATILAPRESEEYAPPRTLAEAFVIPFKEFFSRQGALGMIALIILYKLGDAFAVSLSTTFLIRGMGFDVATIGYVNKLLAMVTTIVGALAGGALTARLGLYRSLMLFGLLQAVSNLSYWLIAVSPKSVLLMATAIGIENLCGGLGTAAFLALIMALCHEKFTATQFALLSAIAGLGRVYLAGPLSPFLVESLGWAHFFLLTVLFAFPGLVLLWVYRRRVQALS